MASQISWDLYRSFLSVLKEGSFSGAARALGIAQPTVGRHIAALERALHIPLFTRSQTGLLPTEAAVALKTHVESMQGIAAAIERTAAGQGEGVRGVVRVTASELIGVEVLPGVLARLQAQHPELTVELVVTNRVQDLLHRDADIAVRTAPPQQKALVARRIGRIEVGFHARKDYVARYGTPRNMADLSRHRLIGFDEVTAYIRDAGRAVPAFRREAFAIRTDSDLAQLALLRAGAGIGVCQVPIALRADNLERVLPKVSLYLETWIAMHEDLRHNPSCRVTFEALAEGMQQHIAAAG